MATSKEDRQRAIVATLCGLAFFYCFVSIGETYISDWSLDFGSLYLPSRRHTLFAYSWLLFGGLGSLALIWGITVGLAPEKLRPRTFSDRAWIIACTLVAALAPLLVRIAVLKGTPVSDDESAYQFAAELLAKGSLSSDSHAAKLFFDRQFMINDGQLLSRFFLGWPALMTPFVLAGAEGFANAAYSAATVFPLFWVAHRMAGPFAARTAAVLFASSPLVLIGAATQLPQTSCLCALTWMLFFAVAWRDDRPSACGVGVGGFFGVALLVQPLPAAAIGLPVLVTWMARVWRLAPVSRRRSLLALGLVLGMFVALFFAINAAQNGSALRTSYERMSDYATANGMRFTTWQGGATTTDQTFGRGLSATFAIHGAAILRLSPALFGWATSFALAFLAFSDRRARLAWVTLASFVLGHAFMSDAGIDLFAPLSYAALALPLILLSAIGLDHARRLLAESERWRRAPVIALSVLVGSSALFYLPPRLAAIAEVSSQANAVLGAPDRYGLGAAVIFSPVPFVPQCPQTTRSWLFFRPNNDPALENQTLWVNHLGVDEDERFMNEHFPEREARILVWNYDCEALLLTFDQARAAGVAPSHPAHIIGVYPDEEIP